MCMSSDDARSFHLNDVTPLFYAISRTIPPVGAITSFLNALFDIYDLFSHLIMRNVKERYLIVKSAFYRFISNVILGFGNLAPMLAAVPYLSYAALLTINPLIIPLIALHPVYINFKKNIRLAYVAHQDVLEKRLIFLANPTRENLDNLNKAKEIYYAAKQEAVISTGLLIGTTMCVIGVFIPPVLLAGVILSVMVSLLGLLDKRYQFTKKIHKSIFGEDKDTSQFNTAYLRTGGMFSQPKASIDTSTKLAPLLSRT